jgi:hypothetical protein
LFTIEFRQRASVDRELAAIGLIETGDQPQQCALATAGATVDDGHPSLLEVVAESVEHPSFAAVPEADCAQLHSRRRQPVGDTEHHWRRVRQWHGVAG